MTDRPGQRPSRWFRIILVLSLALNLLFVGLVAGSAWKWRSAGGSPRSVEFSMGPLGRALSVDNRRAMSIALEGRGDLRPPSPRDMRGATEDLIGLLRATPFDGEAFAASLDDLRSHARDLQTAGQAAFVEVVVEMSDEERAAFADRVESQAQRGSRPDGERDRKSR